MKNTKTTLAIVPLAVLFFSMAALLATAFESPAAPEKLVDGEIAKLQPWIGNWEINSKWASGQALWARNEYRVGLGGKFVEADTYAKDGDGEPYHRYKTIFTFDESKKKFVSYGFTSDGKVQVVENKLEQVDGKVALTSSWAMGETEVKQTVKILNNDEYAWNVWMRPVEGDAEWAQSMEGTWKRVE